MAIRATSFLNLLRSTASRRWFSTETLIPATSPASETTPEQTPATAITEEKRGSAVRRVLSDLAGKAESEINITDALNKVHNDGKPLKRLDITGCINHLRRKKKFTLALQLSEWMESSKIKINNADRAVRIDLLAKTEGICSAEVYFDSLQESAKTLKTYGALLSCYSKHKMLDKALTLFEKMKELKFTSTLNYNNVISLYLATGQPDKVPPLVKEMEQSNIAADLYTYNQLINCYVSVQDMDSVEDVLTKMKNNQVKFDWFTYGNLATIYVKAGKFDRANSVLQKMEEVENLSDHQAFHTLITLYQQTSNLSGVLRAWESLKLVAPTPRNVSYLIMLLALSKLGDVENLEKYFREWESCCKLYDARISNVIIESYLKRNMIEEANLLYENVLKQGGEPKLKTFDAFTNFYIKNSQIDLALKYLEMGANKVKPEKRSWFPEDETIKMFLAYFEDNNDSVRAEKFCEIMKKIGHHDSTVYDSLLHTNSAAS